MSQPDFWKDNKKAQEVITELKRLKSSSQPWEKAQEKCQELGELLEIIDSHDTPSISHLEKDLSRLYSDVAKLEFATLLSEKEDKNNAIISIHAGAGGTESCDWAAMITRMYLRWAENKGFAVEHLDFLPGEEAGTKNITFMIKGEYAYGYLKAEHGIHRMIRISPFDATGRRHTSFASVSVLPEIDTDIKIEIDEGYIKIVPVLYWNDSKEEDLDGENSAMIAKERDMKLNVISTKNAHTLSYSDYKNIGLEYVEFSIKEIHNIPWSSIYVEKNSLIIGSKNFTFTGDINNINKRGAKIDVRSISTNKLELTTTFTDVIR